MLEPVAVNENAGLFRLLQDALCFKREAPYHTDRRRGLMNIGMLTMATAQSGDLAEVARQVEALGYDSLWIPEHPVVPVQRTTPFPASRDGHMPEHYMQWADPFIALTVAATVTKTIKLGTGICLLPERDPLITA